jgi:hypothetical protein
MMETAGSNAQSVTVQEVYHYMNDRNVIMSFLGELSHSTVTSILYTLKGVLNTIEADFLVKKRLYNVMVECLDNISRHNIVKDGDAPGAMSLTTIFTISDNSDHFEIQTGNYILNSRIEELTRKIEQVNSLDKSGLQAQYRARLLENPPTGGGLGILDISIKTGCRLSYEFRPVNKEMSFFIFKTIVSK